MDILAALEASAPVAALKRSFLVYPLVSAGHVLAIGMLVTSVVLMDLRLLGLLRSVERAPFERLMRRVVLAAFALAAATGLALFSVRARDYAASALFLGKLALILLAAANMLALVRFRRDAEAPPSGPARLAVLLSLVLWPAILVCGRFLGFV